MNGIRIDKWLWAARFFKTRTLAARACELSRARIGGQLCKASRDVRIGDLLTIRTEAAEFEVEVLGLAEQRGSAAIAQALYRETEESRKKRSEAAEQRKLMPWFEVVSEGKPSKRDRRRYDDVRGR